MNIPEKYSNNETLSNAYARGWNHGHGIACHNVPEMGVIMRSDSLGRALITPENIREYHESFCFEAESNSRDFSPFEFTAHEFNSLGDDEESETTNEEAWEAFEDGVGDSIRSDLSSYTDEDYGINDSQN